MLIGRSDREAVLRKATAAMLEYVAIAETVEEGTRQKGHLKDVKASQ